MKEYNFIEIVFMFFGIYEGFSDEDKTKESPLVNLYGDLISSYIITASDYTNKDAMVVVIKWTKVFLSKEYGTQDEQLDLIEARLHRLIYAIDKGVISTSACDETRVIELEQIELSDWFIKNKIKRPAALIPIDEKQPTQIQFKTSNTISTYVEYLKKSITRWEAGDYNFDIDDKYFHKTGINRKVIPLSGVDLMSALKKEYPDIYKKIRKGMNVTNQRFWGSEERKKTCRLSVNNAQNEAFKKKII